MGVAIIAYRNIHRTDIPIECDERGSVIKHEGYINLFREVSDAYEEAHEGRYGTHPGYFDGLDEKVYYKVGAEICPISVAYSTYETFRNVIEEYATEKACDVHLFREMIEFSDCEGTFGPVVCGKLLADFEAHRDGFFEYADKVLGTEEESWFSAEFAKNLYDSYIEALEAGADNGVVIYG